MKPCRFSKDGAAYRRRRAGIRKPARLRRRTRVGGTDGACGNAGAAAASGEEHSVRYIDQSAGRPRFYFWERILVIDSECADCPGGGFCARYIWRCPSTDGDVVDIVEPARRSSGAVLDREHVLVITKKTNRYGYSIESLSSCGLCECSDGVIMQICVA